MAALSGLGEAAKSAVQWAELWEIATVVLMELSWVDSMAVLKVEGRAVRSVGCWVEQKEQRPVGCLAELSVEWMELSLGKKLVDLRGHVQVAWSAG